MAFEMIVGLFVANREKYEQYRLEIASLLQAAGGKFRYDLEVARVLRSEEDHDINRLFVIQFPDQTSKERFFNDGRYVDIRTRLFEKSVGARTIIAEYEVR